MSQQEYASSWSLHNILPEQHYSNAASAHHTMNKALDFGVWSSAGTGAPLVGAVRNGF